MSDFWSFLIPNKSLLNFIKYRDELRWSIFHCGNVNCLRDSKSFENLYSSCKCEISTTPKAQTVFYVINNREEVTFVSQVSILAVVHTQCSNFVSIQIDPSMINGFASDFSRFSFKEEKCSNVSQVLKIKFSDWTLVVKKFPSSAYAESLISCPSIIILLI